MRKLSTVSIDNRPRVRKRRIMLMLILPPLLLLSPVIYESAVLCVANWQGLFGSHPHTSTPVLDVLGDAYQTTSHDFRLWSRGIFNRTPWRSSFVIPFAIFWTGVLALLLRKC
jgi:hypothetical protein